MSDWIKVEKATLHKPEVLALSEALNIHPVHAFGLCVKFWMWCDDQILDGNARGVTKVTLDFVIGHTGMTDALLKVGWLRDRSGSLEIPHFDRHLSEGAKTRALTKERVRKTKAKSNGEEVTEVTQEPLLEKRREDKNKASSNEEATRHRKMAFLLDEEFWAEMRRHYPEIEVETESRKMDAWLLARPGRKKTRQFVINWLNKVEPPLKPSAKPEEDWDYAN